MKLINKNLINIDLKSTEKKEALKEMVVMLENEGRVTNAKKFLDDVIKREEEITTGFGDGLAIPHAQSDYVKEPTLLFAKSKEGIEYDSLDGKKVNILFMIAIPKAQKGDHLKLLQMLSRKFMDENFKKELEKIDDKEELLNLIESIFNEEKEETKVKKEGQLNVVAISNCPAGIAHTYMVAESLEKKAEELGINIKVETQGASGVENKLTNEDVSKADYVVLALGKGIDEKTKQRFNGKKVYNIKISEALKNIDKIFDELEEKSKVMNVDSDAEEEQELTGVFQHLMNGVSFVIPFVVAGGLILSLSTILGSFIANEPGTITNMFETVGVYGLSFMTPILGGYIAYSIADKPGLAPGFLISYMANDKGLLQTESGAGFLGAIILGLAVGYFVKWMKSIKLNKTIQPLMSFLIIPFVTTLIFSILTFYLVGPILAGIMSFLNGILISSSGASALLTSIVIGMMICFDAGGPVNKTAFLFALGLVDQGIYNYYGVVAVGVIVPSMAAGIASQVKPKLFSKTEVEGGKAAIISGSFGIGEPSIPFIVADPKPLMIANLISGAYIGIVAYFFDIQRIAPGPGLIEPLLGITTPAFGFYFAIVTGIIVNATLIIMFKNLFRKK